MNSTKKLAAMQPDSNQPQIDMSKLEWEPEPEAGTLDSNAEGQDTASSLKSLHEGACNPGAHFQVEAVHSEPPGLGHLGSQPAHADDSPPQPPSVVTTTDQAVQSGGTKAASEPPQLDAGEQLRSESMSGPADPHVQPEDADWHAGISPIPVQDTQPPTVPLSSSEASLAAAPAPDLDETAHKTTVAEASSEVDASAEAPGLPMDVPAESSSAADVPEALKEDDDDGFGGSDDGFGDFEEAGSFVMADPTPDVSHTAEGTQDMQSSGYCAAALHSKKINELNALDARY